MTDDDTTSGEETDRRPSKARALAPEHDEPPKARRVNPPSPTRRRDDDKTLTYDTTYLAEAKVETGTYLHTPAKVHMYFISSSLVSLNGCMTIRYEMLAICICF